MTDVKSCLLIVLSALQCSAVRKEVPTPGFGYPGALSAYRSSAKLKTDMSRFGMSAGWFRRSDLPVEYTHLQTPQVNELPYLLYAPKRSTKPVPMVIYFGGTGEQGTDLSLHFRQTTLFSHLTEPEFQKKHPCYIFAPMFPTGAVIRAALPGDRSMMADLVCDTMYAVIAANDAPKVDTNRLYVTGLSWGGVAAFELSCSYPGRFAACVPTACIQSPMRIPRERPGNYWMLYNENTYKSEWSQSAICEISRTVKDGAGDFRCSTFPDAGHAAWRKAWCEDAVWEWVFSKGERARLPRAKSAESLVFQQISTAKCTSSIPGKDVKHGLDRFLDGLDATAYESKFNAQRGDWVEITFEEPVKGKFTIHSGWRDGSKKLSKSVVEASVNGSRWGRVGTFSARDGVARLELRTPAKKLRITYAGAKPMPLVLRKIAKETR